MSRMTAFNTQTSLIHFIYTMRAYRHALTLILEMLKKDRCQTFQILRNPQYNEESFKTKFVPITQIVSTAAFKDLFVNGRTRRVLANLQMRAVWTKQLVSSGFTTTRDVQMKKAYVTLKFKKKKRSLLTKLLIRLALRKFHSIIIAILRFH